MASFAIAWRLLMHSLTMLTRNVGTILKIFTFPIMLSVLLIIAIFVQVQGGVMFQLFMGDIGSVIGPLFLVFVFVILINLVLIWPIITWHRFVLLETPVDWVNRVEISRIFSYFLSYVGIVVLVLIPTLTLVWAFGMSGGVLFTSLWLVFNYTISIVMPWVIYRLTPVLPGVALGLEGNGFGAAWTATKPGSGVLFCLSVILAVFGLLQSGAGLILPEGLFVVVSVLISIFLFFLQISIATTIYGVYVEGREI